MTADGRPAPGSVAWWKWAIVSVVILLALALAVSIAVTTWRLIVPRPATPPTPIYVCIYTTDRGGLTTMAGSTVCAVP